MAGIAALQSSFSGLSVRGYGAGGVLGGGASLRARSVEGQSAKNGPLSITMEIKRWEKKKVKPNGLPLRQKLHVKVGDTIMVIAGADKGKVSEITRLFSHNSKVVCKDVNIKTKHVKKRAEGESGQIIQLEAPIHSSNVMLYSRQSKVASRVGHKTLEDGTKVRYLLKTGEVLDDAAKAKEQRLKPKDKKGDDAA